jgi:hypothetical protein
MSHIETAAVGACGGSNEPVPLVGEGYARGLAGTRALKSHPPVPRRRSNGRCHNLNSTLSDPSTEPLSDALYPPARPSRRLTSAAGGVAALFTSS